MAKQDRYGATPLTSWVAICHVVSPVLVLDRCDYVLPARDEVERWRRGRRRQIFTRRWAGKINGWRSHAAVGAVAMSDSYWPMDELWSNVLQRLVCKCIPTNALQLKPTFHGSSFLVANVKRMSLACDEEIWRVGRVGRGCYENASDCRTISTCQDGLACPQ